MQRKIIVLADSSYTIRRIVELSFSEMENVQVVSVETGSGLKEKLLELKPAVVIVDVKLPVLNGYEVCRFINQSPDLAKTRILLLKGSFEPIDQEMSKNLRFEDIVTKPFDSNALISIVMKVIEKADGGVAAPREMPAESPTSFPEDLAEIDSGAAVEEEINFADIRQVMQPKVPPAFDEIQPSEEITVGSQPVKDHLAPESEDMIDNPFAEEKGELKKEPPRPVVEPPAPVDEPSFAVEEVSLEDTSEVPEKAEIDQARVDVDEEGQFPGDLLGFQKEAPAAGPAEEAEKGVPETFFGQEKGLADFAIKPPAAAKEPVGDIEDEKPFLQESEKRYHDVLSGTEKLALLEQEIAAEAARSYVAERKPFADATATTKGKETAAGSELSESEKGQLLGKIEDKLVLAIKEMLWEVIPPLAEKIIKDEIEKLKSEVPISD